MAQAASAPEPTSTERTVMVHRTERPGHRRIAVAEDQIPEYRAKGYVTEAEHRERLLAPTPTMKPSAPQKEIPKTWE